MELILAGALVGGLVGILVTWLVDNFAKQAARTWYKETKKLRGW